MSHFRDQEPATLIEESWPLFARGGGGVSKAGEGGVRSKEKNSRGRTHVGGDEHPLGECPGRELLVKEGEVLGLGEAAGAVADGFIAD